MKWMLALRRFKIDNGEQALALVNSCVDSISDIDGLYVRLTNVMVLLLRSFKILHMYRFIQDRCNVTKCYDSKRVTAVYSLFHEFVNAEPLWRKKTSWVDVAELLIIWGSRNSENIEEYDFDATVLVTEKIQGVAYSYMRAASLRMRSKSSEMDMPDVKASVLMKSKDGKFVRTYGGDEDLPMPLDLAARMRVENDKVPPEFLNLRTDCEFQIMKNSHGCANNQFCRVRTIPSGASSETLEVIPLDPSGRLHFVPCEIRRTTKTFTLWYEGVNYDVDWTQYPITFGKCCVVESTVGLGFYSKVIYDNTWTTSWVKSYVGISR